MPVFRSCAAALMMMTAMLAAPPARSPAGRSSLITAEPLDTKPSADAIMGQWLTEDKKGHVRVTRQNDGTYIGVLTWAAPGAPPKDVNNKDPKLRDRAMLGIVLMWHLRYTGGEYVDGYIYDPENGDTYTMKATLEGNDTLKLRGYVAIPLLGQSQTWSRLP
jgi:uncharacterized protein (DUF2147 family)